MTKILAFAASLNSQSINQRLATYAASLASDADAEVISIRDFEMPLYSQDRERESGIPKLARDFFAKIGESDALIISFAEHNGSYSAGFKSLLDWCSRIDHKVWQGKRVLLLSTSPGGRGGASVLQAATDSAPFFGGEVTGSLSVPAFYANFDSETGALSNEELNAELQSLVSALVAGS